MFRPPDLAVQISPLVALVADLTILVISLVVLVAAPANVCRKARWRKVDRHDERCDPACLQQGALREGDSVLRVLHERIHLIDLAVRY